MLSVTANMRSPGLETAHKTEPIQRRAITPTEGGLTNDYVSLFGKDDGDLGNRRDRETTVVIDGLKGVEEHYDIFVSGGYFYAIAPETLFSENSPKVGLKIHVALDSEDDSYGERLLRMAELCLRENPDGKSTTFKVMTYSNHKSLMEFDPDQARKVVTIYPNYLTGEKTNVPETIRLVTDLREIMAVDPQGDSEEVGIYNEHKSGEGIYLRAGAFTKEGRQYETVSKEAPFDEQLQGNLVSPETDANLFTKEITDAIESGFL